MEEVSDQGKRGHQDKGLCDGGSLSRDCGHRGWEQSDVPKDEMAPVQQRDSVTLCCRECEERERCQHLGWCWHTASRVSPKALGEKTFKADHSDQCGKELR